MVARIARPAFQVSCSYLSFFKRAALTYRSSTKGGTEVKRGESVGVQQISLLRLKLKPARMQVQVSSPKRVSRPLSFQHPR